jgi:ABC-2 type transport system permease protein
MTAASTLPTEQASRREIAPNDSATPASRLQSCWTLYLLTLRQHLHGRRWIAVALLFLLPAALAVLIRSAPPTVHRFIEFVLVWILIPQALLPLVALLYASGIIQDEQEDQTITYLLIRPIPKWMLYWIKMAATWTTTVFLVILLTVVTYAAVYIGTDADLSAISLRCLKAAAILSLATIAYCSLFGLLSLLTKRTLLVGILYTAVVEGLLANLPLSLRWGTVLYYTRLLAYRTMEFLVTWPRGSEVDVAATAWLLDIESDPTLAEHPTIRTCILVLVCGSLICTAIAAVLCSNREFHVKTPEKE